MYDMVRNKTWNWDNFEAILKQISDRAPDGVYPIIYSSSMAIMTPFIISNNGRITENNKTTGLMFVGDENQNALDAMNFVVDRIVAMDTLHPRSPLRDHGTTIHVQFCGGEAVFAFDNYLLLKNISKKTAGFETDYTFGILPPPMGNDAIREGRAEYLSVTTYEVRYSICAGADNPREAAAILVAMANRTVKTERVIEHEAANTLFDGDSKDMLILMLNNNTADLMNIASPGYYSGPDPWGPGRYYYRFLSQTTSSEQAMRDARTIMQMHFDVLNDMIDNTFLS
jgi:hypothetical protein